MTWLSPSWEVRTKVSCDALTSVVGASKPTLEESFYARADIYNSSDDDSKPIVSQRNEPQLNRYHCTKEQGLRYNLIGEQIGLSSVRASQFTYLSVLFGIRACSEIGHFTLYPYSHIAVVKLIFVKII